MSFSRIKMAKHYAEKRLKIWDFPDGRPLIIASGQKIQRTVRLVGFGDVGPGKNG